MVKVEYLKKKINTTRTLLAGSDISNTQYYTHILHELNETIDSSIKKAPNHRIALLQIFHLTRTLDSSLAALTSYHGYTIDKADRHINGYFKALSTQTPSGRKKLTNCGKYYTSIVHPRNKYMHKAGAFPSTPNEVRDILNEICECLEYVLR